MEYSKYFFIFLFNVVLCFYTALGQAPTYTGAVVEYETMFDPTASVQNNMDRNVEEYLVFMKRAKTEGADIIVFPECGLTTVHLPNNHHDVMPYTRFVPDPKDKINPCNTARSANNPWSSVLIKLSCGAQNNSIYVVANFPERAKANMTSDTEELFIYNTNVVFDRNGTVIARYRKYNLFGEPAFNTTKEPELVSFTTDFGVTFGIFTCFDILFAQPALELLRTNENITDIVYPTAWFSELPFLTAVQTQVGWARANGVNLLASGYDDTKNASGGSGIYRADGHIHYYVPTETRSILITGKIPKIKKREPNPNIPNNIQSTDDKVNKIKIANKKGVLHTWKENMTNYTTVLLNKTNLNDHEICHGKFCCRFTLKFTPQNQSNYFYRMIVYEGPRYFGSNLGRVEVCGIAACRNESKNSCGERLDEPVKPTQFAEIMIRGVFKNDKLDVHFPSAVNFELEPYDITRYNYIVTPQQSNKVIRMETRAPVNRILGFGIYGIVKSAANTNFSIVPVILLACLTVFIYNKIRA